MWKITDSQNFDGVSPNSGGASSSGINYNSEIQSTEMLHEKTQELFDKIVNSAYYIVLKNKNWETPLKEKILFPNPTNSKIKQLLQNIKTAASNIFNFAKIEEDTFYKLYEIAKFGIEQLTTPPTLDFKVVTQSKIFNTQLTKILTLKPSLNKVDFNNYVYDCIYPKEISLKNFLNISENVILLHLEHQLFFLKDLENTDFQYNPNIFMLAKFGYNTFKANSCKYIENLQFLHNKAFKFLNNFYEDEFQYSNPMLKKDKQVSSQYVLNDFNNKVKNYSNKIIQTEKKLNSQKTIF